MTKEYCSGSEVLHAARPGVLRLLELGRIGDHLHLQGQEDTKVSSLRIIFKIIFNLIGYNHWLDLFAFIFFTLILQG